MNRKHTALLFGLITFCLSLFLWWLSGFNFDSRGPQAFFGTILVLFFTTWAAVGAYLL